MGSQQKAGSDSEKPKRKRIVKASTANTTEEAIVEEPSAPEPAPAPSAEQKRPAKKAAPKKAAKKAGSKAGSKGASKSAGRGKSKSKGASTLNVNSPGGRAGTSHRGPRGR